MRLWKKIVLPLVVVILVCGVYGWHLYTKAPASAKKQPAYRELTAEDLMKAFEADEAAANREYIDKVLIVSGIVTNTEMDSSGHATLILETGDPLQSVTCSFDNDETAAVKKITPGKKVRIKGKCTGKLIDVVLNQCSMAE